MNQFSFDIVGFDLDGTLLETSGDLAEAVNHALGTIGISPFPVEDIRRFVGRGARVMLERALTATGHEAPELVERLLPLLLDHYAANLSRHSYPFPGLLAVLDELTRHDIRLAICTNKVERFTLPLLQQLNLIDYFDIIICGDTVGTLKPDPAPLKAMIERAGGGRCLFVGDTSNDTIAARKAGVPSVIVSFGFCDGPPAQLGGDMVINHYDELLPIVKNWPL